MFNVVVFSSFSSNLPANGNRWQRLWLPWTSPPRPHLSSGVPLLPFPPLPPNAGLSLRIDRLFASIANNLVTFPLNVLLVLRHLRPRLRKSPLRSKESFFSSFSLFFVLVLFPINNYSLFFLLPFQGLRNCSFKYRTISALVCIFFIYFYFSSLGNLS